MTDLHLNSLADLTQAMKRQPGGPGGSLCVVMPGGGPSLCVVMPGDA